ncbi:MAG: hypothetical protein ACOCV1_00880 [Bacillota bacterium]
MNKMEFQRLEREYQKISSLYSSLKNDSKKNKDKLFILITMCKSLISDYNNEIRLKETQKNLAKHANRQYDIGYNQGKIDCYKQIIKDLYKLI